MQTTIPRNTSHYYLVDLLRFMAAAGVVFYHFGTVSGVAPNPFAPPEEQAFPFLGEWTRFGWLGVQFFFVLSGVVIAKSALASIPSDFLVKRAIRILPVLWICATLALIVVWLHEGVSIARFADWLRTIFLSPKGPYIDGVVWTLVVEAIFYAGTCLAIALTRTRGGYAAWMDMIAFLLTSLTVGYVAVHLALLVSSIELAASMRWFGLTVLLLHHGAFFGLGMAITSMFMQGVTYRRLLLSALAVVAGSLQIMLQTGEMSDGLIGVAIWLGSVVLLVFSLQPVARVTSAPTQRFLRRLGMVSYPLYLGHFTLGAFLIPMASTAIGSPVAVFLLAWGFVLSLAFLVAEYPERQIQAWMKSGTGFRDQRPAAFSAE